MKKILLIIILFLATFSSFSQNFISEIKAFERQDSISIPREGQILLAGSSTFRLWTTFQQDLKDFSVINRGFGGSQMSDLNYYFDRIVLKYKPKIILVYEGDNDLNAGENPDSVIREFKGFVQMVKVKLPNTKIAFCSIRPSLARTAILDKQKSVNQAITKFSKKKKNVYFIDIQKDFYLPNGQLMQNIFVADKLHLNQKGYEIWAKATRKFLNKKLKANTKINSHDF
ncbi:MAG: GDSL-type esterase/lipase family protein [Arcicella sp.]|nr:GDSL-type esterase/lipase family protein [Arcicella sp.]